MGMHSYPMVHRLTAWTSRKSFREPDGEMFSDRCDRVFDVPFRSDRRRRRVGNLWVAEAVVVQTFGINVTKGRELDPAHAARTAFQISGAVLALMRSFPSLN
jgi:hypothetical protein